MDGLIAYSKERGDRCRPPVLADKRAEVEPIVLESALETSRVVADLLHTLGRLVPQYRDSWSQWVSGGGSQLPPGKVVLLGTKYSTLQDYAGSPVFRGLPAGRYKCVVFRGGLYQLSGEVTVSSRLGREDIQLSYMGFAASHWQPDLVRNSNFEIRWLTKDAPDCWYPTKTAWEGDLIPLKDGARYTLRLNWQAQPGPGDVVLRFRPNTHPGLPVVDSAPFKPGITEHAFTGSDKLKWAQILIRTTNAPTTLLKGVAITPE